MTIRRVVRATRPAASPLPCHHQVRMKDGPWTTLLKRVVLAAWSLELWLRRCLGSGWRRSHWELVGACRGCGCCCLEPTIAVGPVTWLLPAVRSVFVAWHRRVNGFELQSMDRDTHSLVFRCTHYDPVAKRCDSYASRPSMCRDYPRVLLGQAWPELFSPCGHRVRARNAQSLRARIDATDLSEPAKADLRKRLRLE
jgi:uncharacterized protein